MRRTHVVGLLVIVLSLGLHVSPASANWYGATGQTGCASKNEADDQAHSFAYVSLRSDVLAAASYARSTVYEPTVLTTSVVPESANTDAIIRNQDYTTYCGYNWHDPFQGGVVGLATCNSTTGPPLSCNSHSARVDLSFFDETSTANERGVMCHEVGHTLGFDHRDVEPSCMEAAVPQPAVLSVHDKNHLSADL